MKSNDQRVKTDNPDEIISRFMGFEPYQDGRYGTMWPDPSRKGNPVVLGTNYAHSWDWLMPVVSAIEEIEEPHPSNNPEKGTVWPYQVDILSRNKVEIYDHINDEMIVLLNQDGLTKIQAVYKAVLEFIEWHKSKSS